MRDGYLTKGLLLLFLVGAALPWTSAPMALAAGIGFAQFLGNPWSGSTSRWSKRLLQLSVTGLGFGMSLPAVWKTGRGAVGYTVIGITATMLAGLLLGRLAGTPPRTSALMIATTVKLIRAMWIIPCALGAGWLLGSEGRAKFPLFIAGFLTAAALRTMIPAGEPLWNGLEAVAKQSLVVTLFLVGLGLTREVLRRNGPRPLVQGVLLWLAVSVGTLSAIETGWIR